MKLFFILLVGGFAAGRESCTGTRKGITKKCVFPFVYLGRKHWTCVTYESVDPWCSTKVDSMGNHVLTQFAKCDKNCPEVVVKKMQVDPRNERGKCTCGIANHGAKGDNKYHKADVGEYPWQVALFNDWGGQFCGGTLVGERHVVTAAHCTYGKTPGSIKVLVGDTNLATKHDATAFMKNVSKIINYPRYTSEKIENDISILKLESAVNLTMYPNIKPVCLPTQTIGKPLLNTFVDKPAVITGWKEPTINNLSVFHLQEYMVNINNKTNCGNSTLDPSMLCVASQKSCQGDSGGPLVAKDPNNYNAFSLIGVSSWGLGCSNKEGPHLFADVSYFMQSGWLQTMLRDAVTCLSYDLPTKPFTSFSSYKLPVQNSTLENTNDGSCKTVDGRTCIFPFKTKGRYNKLRTYHGCARWGCATALKENREVLDVGKCRSDCPKDFD